MKGDCSRARRRQRPLSPLPHSALAPSPRPSLPASPLASELPRMAPFVTLALAQFQPRKGDYAANLARIGAAARAGRRARASTAARLLSRDGAERLLPRGRGARARGHRGTARRRPAPRRTATGAPVDVCIGFYEVWRNKLYNSAHLRHARARPMPLVRHVHRKVFLPTYGLFDEERFVERGRDVRAFDTPWGRAAMLVCEDAWHSLTGDDRRARRRAADLRADRAARARRVAQDGRACPGRPACSRWERLARDIADEHGVYVALAQPRGQRGRQAVPGRRDGRRTEGRGARARPALGRGARRRDDRPARRDARARRHAAHRRPRDDDAAPARRARRRWTRGTPHLLAYDGMDGDRRDAMGAPEARTMPARHASPRRTAVTRRERAHRVASCTATRAAARAPLEIDAALVEQWLVALPPRRDAAARLRAAPSSASRAASTPPSPRTSRRAPSGRRTSSACGCPTARRAPRASRTPARDRRARHRGRTVDISAAVDGYLAARARCRPGAPRQRDGAHCA